MDVCRRYRRVLLALGLSLAAGCTAAPLGSEGSVKVERDWITGRVKQAPAARVQAVHGRSLAVDAPALRRLAASEPAGGTRWYDLRNDVPLSTYAGYQGPIVDVSVTDVYDQQSISGNRVRDYYYNATYRSRVVETVR